MVWMDCNVAFCALSKAGKTLIVRHDLLTFFSQTVLLCVAAAGEVGNVK
jgi:hypothetical protein